MAVISDRGLRSKAARYDEHRPPTITVAVSQRFYYPEPEAGIPRHKGLGRLMKLLWVSEPLIFIVWVAISAFLWNNRFRFVSDTAPVLRGLIFPAILRILEILLPLGAAALIFVRYGILLSLLTVAVFYIVWRVISSTYYKSVFRQYSLLHMDDLAQKGDIYAHSKAEIDELVHELLMTNLRK